MSSISPDDFDDLNQAKETLEQFLAEFLAKSIESGIRPPIIAAIFLGAYIKVLALSVIPEENIVILLKSHAKEEFINATLKRVRAWRDIIDETEPKETKEPESGS